MINGVLNPERVDAIFLDCLFLADEDTTNKVEAHGIAMNIIFHPGRLEHHRPEIEAMLKELPNNFMESGGGGWSFLNGCFAKDGSRWTGFQKEIEKLFLLGTAIGKVECISPREVWFYLPGGMPYYLVKF